jgi:hypothetical protein
LALNQAEKEFDVIIGAPPATGKTSLLHLVRLNMSMRYDVRYFAPYACKTYQELERQFASATDIFFNDIKKTHDKLRNLSKLWILIDEAHKLYGEEFNPFWESLIKTRHELFPDCQIRCLIASTYDMHTPGVSPVFFDNKPHLNASNLAISEDEANNLFDNLKERLEIYEPFHRFKSCLYAVSNGHIGVYVQGYKTLQTRFEMPPKYQPITEDQVINILHSKMFVDKLGRNFGSVNSIPDEQIRIITEAIVIGANQEVSLLPVEERYSIDIKQASLVQLRRAGILTSGAEFTCLAASWYYHSLLFPSRPHPAADDPKSLDDLVLRAVSELSAQLLKTACDKGNFPLEASFQHLFYGALCSVLKTNVTVLPELNTYRYLPGGKEGGFLDFYINGEKKWAMEFLRLGDRMKQHVERFHPKRGKYRGVQPKEYLVIDCRGPKEGKHKIIEDEHICTLYFAIDFQTCVCKMRLNPEITVKMKP